MDVPLNSSEKPDPGFAVTVGPVPESGDDGPEGGALGDGWGGEGGGVLGVASGEDVGLLSGNAATFGLFGGSTAPALHASSASLAALSQSSLQPMIVNMLSFRATRPLLQISLH